MIPKLRLIPQQTNWSLLKGNFSMKWIFHIEQRIIFIKVFFILQSLIVKVKVFVLFIFNMLLLIINVWVHVFVVLSFLNELSLFSRYFIIIDSSIVRCCNFLQIRVDSEFIFDPFFIGYGVLFKQSNIKLIFNQVCLWMLENMLDKVLEKQPEHLLVLFVGVF